jgi:hypothetical protein
VKVNFAEFLVAPLFNAITKLLPELTPCKRTMCDNVKVSHLRRNAITDKRLRNRTPPKSHAPVLSRRLHCVP